MRLEPVKPAALSLGSWSFSQAWEKHSRSGVEEMGMRSTFDDRGPGCVPSVLSGRAWA
jgi:hypothetical protein